MSSESAPNSTCIDAETLAAWSDGALSVGEAAEVELHLSNCARCQAVLAAFVRTSEEHRESIGKASEEHRGDGRLGTSGRPFHCETRAAAAHGKTWRN